MLIFCNPSNPTGAVHSREEQEALAKVLAQDNAAKVWVMADEIYERITYDGVEHVSFAALEGTNEGSGEAVSMWPRTMTVNGFSKAYAMTGYRLGYLAAPKHVVKACTTLQGQITSCASSIAQHAALAALAVPDEVLDPLFEDMKGKRDQVLSGPAHLPFCHSTNLSPKLNREHHILYNDRLHKYFFKLGPTISPN